MKKLFIAALIVVAAATSAFATDASNARAKTNFEAMFAGAQNVSWTSKDSYLKASFTIGEAKAEAFFGYDGELIGLSRKVDLKNLPLNAIQKIKKDYASYTVTDSIEFDQDGEKSYYVSLEESNKKQILQVSLYGVVTVYKSTK